MKCNRRFLGGQFLRAQFQRLFRLQRLLVKTGGSTAPKTAIFETLGAGFFLCQIQCLYCKPQCAREGVIIEWSLKGQFHDAVIIIITSQLAVIELVHNDNAWRLGKILMLFTRRLLMSVLIQFLLSIMLKSHQIFMTMTMTSIRD